MGGTHRGEQFGAERVVGIGGVIEIPASVREGRKLERFSFTLGMRTEQNPFCEELAAMAYALRHLPDIEYRSVALLASTLMQKCFGKGQGTPLQTAKEESAEVFLQSVETVDPTTWIVYSDGSLSSPRVYETICCTIRGQITVTAEATRTWRLFDILDSHNLSPMREVLSMPQKFIGSSLVFPFWKYTQPLTR
ncbi:hypothetical protein FOMA001_g20106 [Fusarium oxysporum f. sp. matthiolae]|nr:hypothetical protein FOMA001_g20106 [Fusarium oxysporum f. sp. matthiolae]